MSNKKKTYTVFFNAQTRNRTTDTEIFSLLLYQLSYLGTKVGLQGLEPWTYRL
jgi:hypothetical protein